MAKRKSRGKSAFINNAMGAPFLGDKDSTKVMKYGSPLDPQAWNRMNYADKQKRLKGEIGMGDNLRRAQIAKQQEIADARRKYYYGMVTPLEKKMSESVVSDLTTDRNVISDRAMQDVGDAFARARGATQRMRERYGIQARPEDERVQNIEEARAKVNAGNQAVEDTRARGTRNAAMMGRLGMNIPGQATAGMSAGGNAMANQYDYQALLTSGKISNDLSRDQAGSSSVASIFQSFADGGEVKKDDSLDAIKWLRKKLTGNRERPTYSINKDETRRLKDLEDGRYADGGDVRGYGMGGAVDLQTNDFVIPADVPLEAVVEIVREVDPEFAEQLLAGVEA